MQFPGRVVVVFDTYTYHNMYQYEIADFVHKHLMQ